MKLENVAKYMDEHEHRNMMRMWEESCQLAQESCEAAAGVLAHLQTDLRDCGREKKESMKECRVMIRDALLMRAEGWQVRNTLVYHHEMSKVFRKLASEYDLEPFVVSQLMNGARRLQEIVVSSLGDRRRGARRAVGLRQDMPEVDYP